VSLQRPEPGYIDRLGALRSRVAAAVRQRSGDDPQPDDPFRGLYVSDDHARRLAAAGTPGPTTAGPLVDGGLEAFAARFGLDGLDLDIVAVSSAPDVEPAFEKLYGYLHDDVTRRRASVGLAIELAGRTPFDADARRRLAGSSPLVRHGLVVVEDPDRPFLTRALRVPDRVTAHLLGDDRPDPDLLEVAFRPEHRVGGPVEGVARAVSAGERFVYLRERVDAGASGVAAAALRRRGTPVVAVDLSRVAPADARTLAGAAVREARLIDGGLVAGPIDRLEPWLLRAITEVPVPRVLFGRTRWDPAWTGSPPLVFELEPLPAGEQAELWRRHLPAGSIDLDLPTDAFRLGPRQIRHAVDVGVLGAAFDGTPLDASHLRTGARRQNTAGLEQLARRLVPSVGWDDIVVDPFTRQQLHELSARVRHRTTVLDDWGMRRGGGRGENVTALFTGDSGTGKTLAAEVVAGDLGLEVFMIDLSLVVDKYIGETEKNLERVFDEAEGVNGVLFFDEADALFGKRSEVSDARDRYANVEVSFLLQRMETFDGLAVLASNLKSNIDEAFARRLSVVVDFPQPDAALRRQLWELALRGVPRGPDVDLAFCASAFELTGGNIRNIAVSAAYLAAGEGGQGIAMGHLIRATATEYRKLGRLALEREFGPFLEMIRS
jgi:hypothetical protein